MTIKRQPVNTIGLTRADYRGAPSTLCAGCGHDSVASQIVAAAFDLALPPHRVVRMSGIGCSSKSAAYFFGRSHGFNSLHGRMPAVTTGAHVANHTLLPLAVSGDGDTGSIGLGGFKHLLRRNVPMVYIIENNGVYGLTKGQFSATADQGASLKYAGVNELPPIDLCAEALIAGCGFVARSFAGDAKQVRELIKAAFSFRGTAVIDVISPCVTFNNHDESTKSYAYGKAHEEPLHDLTFIPRYDEMQLELEAGEVRDVRLHDGPVIRLRKLAADHDPGDRMAALTLLERARAAGEFVTGLLYLSEARPTLAETLGLGEAPLAALPAERLRPPPAALEAVNAEFR
ncbi:MAG TPA: 2-oxoacid:ferredoxin oxidoreductase subunit beta [Chloroflexaceae bacterium]|nr:2-oxoacid:ferredoxin oxidoreductase subunit beta [Chloroflexaceae bacterium]